MSVFAEEVGMDLPRKIGVGIVTLIPAFVMAGALWSLVQSWIAILILEILVVVGLGYMLSGKRNFMNKV